LSHSISTQFYASRAGALLSKSTGITVSSNRSKGIRASRHWRRPSACVAVTTPMTCDGKRRFVRTVSISVPHNRTGAGVSGFADMPPRIGTRAGGWWVVQSSGRDNLLSGTAREIGTPHHREQKLVGAARPGWTTRDLGMPR
jgi:hypothetical protein